MSYNHKDKQEAYPIIDFLNNNGFKIWHDEGIPVSDSRKESIVRNINGYSAFLIFISPNMVQSEYMRKELNYAIKKHKNLYLIYQ